MADPRFAVYSASDVVIVAPIPLSEGLAEDTFLKITYPERFGDTRGVDGSVCRHSIKNHMADVEVTLKGFSVHNVELSAIHIIDIAAGNGAGIGAFSVLDPNGTSVFAGSRSWIAQPPELGFGEQRPDVTWKFRVMYIPALCIIGGNNTPA